MTTCIRCRGRLEDGTCRGCGRSEDGTRQLNAAALQALNEAREAMRSVIGPQGSCVADGTIAFDAWLAAVESCGCGSCSSRRTKWDANNA